MISTGSTMTRLAGGAMAAVLLAALTACGGPPAWVKQGSAAYDGKAIYGVGAVKGVNNEPLAWENAENRARADILRRFQTYTAYLMRDYAASTTAGDFTKADEEQNVERAVKTFASGTLNGVRSVERYKDEENSIYYVLVKLDFKDMQDALEQNKELNSQVREFVRKNAERLFEKLEKEEEKRGNK